VDSGLRELEAELGRSEEGRRSREAEAERLTAENGLLLRRVESGEIDPSFVITHTVGIDQGPEMYKTFRDKEDGCIKVVLKPWD